jgi:tetratricopeptide (TPR) repeat protein
MLYARPASGFGRILDRGRLWFSAAAALVVSYLLHWGDVPVRFAPSPIARFIGLAPGGYLAPLIILAVIVVPAVIALRSIFGSGSLTVLLSNDYVPLLMCVLAAWAAAYLPLVILRWFAFDLVAATGGWIYVAFNLYAMVLSAFGVRTVYGTGFGQAFGITLLAWIAGLAGAFLFSIIGGALYFLASPLVLIYLWIIFGSNLRSLGDTMRSRQHFQQQLEIATANPHDADAQYQLGLIYQQRHQISEAAARFENAIKIDPTFADALLQLGIIARSQKRLDDAIAYVKRAAAADDRLAQHEVWRELGAAYFEAGDYENARIALEKFTGRREYDPEGLYWYGKVLKQVGRAEEAREMFRRAIEAARTMPSHRRGQVRIWASRSKAEL